MSEPNDTEREAARVWAETESLYPHTSRVGYAHGLAARREEVERLTAERDEARRIAAELREGVGHRTRGAQAMTEPNDSEREAARVWADVVVATQDDGPPFPFIVQPHVWGFAAYVPLKATTLDEAIRDVWTARRGEYANVYALGLAARREEVERLTRERDAAIARAEKAEAEVARLREALVLAREVARDAHRQHHDVWDALDGLERVDDIARAALEPKP